MNYRSFIHFIIFGITSLILVRIGNYYLHNPIAHNAYYSKKKLIVGTNAEYQPFSFFDIAGNIVGFDIDVIKEIAHRLGKKAEIRDMSFEALIPQLQLGSVDIIAAGITPTPQRAQTVNFTNPHLKGTENPLMMVTLKTIPVKSVDQLSNKRIIVNQGYTADYYLSQFKGLNITRLPSAMVAEGLLALESNRADVFVTAKLSIDPLLKEYPNRFISFPLSDTGEKSAFALSKKYPLLLQSVQKALHAMQKDGSLDAIKNKWNLQ